MALRGAARGGGIAVRVSFLFSDSHADADAIYLVIEPGRAAVARFLVVFGVRVRVVVRVLVRRRGQLAGVARPC